jgi:site-specific DNA recombinase
MIAELEKGYIGAVMIKDLSRLGRDHIKMDWYIEEFFPEHNIRLISVGDGLDTAKGEDEFTPFRNLMNEWYARDISKKRKLTNSVKGNAGEPLSPPPYGYKKDPNNPKRWVVDEEAAAVVRRIFRMTLDGFGTEYIAATLERENILTPMNYLLSKGLNRGGIKNAGQPSRWNRSTIIKILSLQEYCGDVINFKTFSRSFKLKKRIKNDEENIKIFKGVHEPIVDRTDFEKIQEKRGQNRRRTTKSGERSIFAGLLVCADCGGNLNYHFNYGNPEIKYFNCANNNRSRKTCPTTHYIREDFLEQIMLQEIRRLTKFATQYEDEFVRIVMGHSEKTAQLEHQSKQRELNKLITRDKELDSLFNKMYEDNASGKIDDERFVRMTRSYTDEQAAIAEKIKTLRAELEKYDEKSDNSDVFLSTVRKYTRVKKLTTQMLNELIERIEVHQSEKVDGVHIQRLTIHYRCVGTLEIPDLGNLPQPEVTMRTRKGVVVSYFKS